jgi:DnaJ family protein C protein 22
MSKSVCVAYFLYFVGGGCGLHHLYLNRSGHALAIYTTFGALFGLGLFRDFFYIPTYVREANADPGFIEELSERMRKNPKVLD